MDSLHDQSAVQPLGFVPFDCDHHYYEAEDAFTRHIEPSMAKRAMQWAEIDGRKRLLVGGRVNRFIPNPTFNPIARPGCLDDYFKGEGANRRHPRVVWRARTNQ